MSEDTIPVSLSDLKILAGLLATESREDDATDHALWLVQGMSAQSVLPPRTPE